MKYIITFSIKVIVLTGILKLFGYTFIMSFEMSCILASYHMIFKCFMKWTAKLKRRRSFRDIVDFYKKEKIINHDLSFNDNWVTVPDDHSANINRDLRNLYKRY